MPRLLRYALLIAFVLGLIPLALVARDRASPSPRPRVQVVPDMDSQPKFKTQKANPLFADGRAMRPPADGAVARGQAALDDRLERGREGDDWVADLPVPVTAALLERGRERYAVFCAPCHGLSGYGDGMVARRADRLQEGTWSPPSSLHDATVRGRPAGHLFNSITNGIRTMPAYGPQMPVPDRWAVVAYVRALQRSQNAGVADVPAEQLPSLR
jgi:mono/diheme cytochrome c family protein